MMTTMRNLTMTTSSELFQCHDVHRLLSVNSFKDENGFT